MNLNGCLCASAAIFLRDCRNVLLVRTPFTIQAIAVRANFDLPATAVSVLVNATGGWPIVEAMLTANCQRTM